MFIEKILTQAIKINQKKILQFPDRRNTDLSLPKNTKETKYLLYLHIPFCEKLCPYCSFNRYLFDLDLAKEYYIALTRELKIYKDYGYDFDEVYIGGGTPTILMEELGSTIELLKKLFSIRKISLETNPNHLTDENIKILKQLRINRLSVGVQSFNNTILKTIERYDKYGSGEEIKEKILLANDNFDTLNIDMIFNFPNQTLKMLEEDMDSIIELDIAQVTFYPIMFFESENDRNIKNLGKLNYKNEKIFYKKILNKLTGYYRPATAWCFSKKNGMIDEYIVNREEYLAAGSGSFGYINGSIYANTFSMKQYIERLNKNELPVDFTKQFSRKEQMLYDFMMCLFGLKLNIEKYNQKYSGNFYKELWKEIIFFKMIGSLTEKGGDLFITQKGMYHWIILMREFFTGVNNFRATLRNFVYL